jgi:thiol-disulfide isomerase/thioredoxin
MKGIVQHGLAQAPGSERMATRISLRTVSHLTALSLLTVLAIALPGEAADAAWPAHVKVVEARITQGYFQEIRKSGRFEIPQLRIYDAKGNRLLSLSGYSERQLSSSLAPLLAGKGKPDASQPLARDLARAERADGKPLGDLPPADLTMVELWASWCAPCHAQASQLAKILREHPNVRVTILHVEADPEKMSTSKPAS